MCSCCLSQLVGFRTKPPSTLLSPTRSQRQPLKTIWRSHPQRCALPSSCCLLSCLHDKQCHWAATLGRVSLSAAAVGPEVQACHFRLHLALATLQYTKHTLGTATHSNRATCRGPMIRVWCNMLLLVRPAVASAQSATSYTRKLLAATTFSTITPRCLPVLLLPAAMSISSFLVSSSIFLISS